MLSSIATFNVLANTTSNQIIETNLSPSDSFSFFKKIDGSISLGYGSDFYEIGSSEKSQDMTLEVSEKGEYEHFMLKELSLVIRSFFSQNLIYI